MLSRIHQKLGTAGFVIALVALVAALGGGAYAASGGLTGKQKKEVKKISQTEAKKFATGGAPGPAGPQGPAGPKGDAGAAGSAGAPGANGKSVVTAAASGSECPGGVGGTKFEVEGSSSSSKVCNGKNGVTGFTETLPAGKTETGSWSLGTIQAEDAPPKDFGNVGILLPIDFTIPLASPIQEGHAHFINTSGEEVEVVTNAEFNLELKSHPQASPAPCPGTREAPAAAPGELCVYEGRMEGPSIASQLIGASGAEIPPLPGINGSTAGVSGALINVQFLTPPNGASWGYGTWAVTAE